jgi:cell division protein FtsQ
MRHLSRKSKDKTPPRRRPAPPRWRRWAWQLGAPAALLLLLLGGGVWLWRAGLPAAAWAKVRLALVDTGARAGLTLKRVVVEGRQNMPRDTILAALDLKLGTPMLAVDPQAIKARLQGLGWIRAVAVERRLPDEVDVRITEAVPVAIWQHDGNFELVDLEGKPIGGAGLGRFAQLPVLVGDHAPQHAGELFAMLGREPDLAARVTAAVWVSERRWNIRFDSGVDVKLPADSAQAAWSLLARLEREKRLLARDISVIDMRLPDRLTIRLGTGAELQRQTGNDT